MRTCYLKFINKNYLNKFIFVNGWIYKIRKHGKLIFIDLKDKSDKLQFILRKNKFNIFFIKKLKNESCVNLISLISFKNLNELNNINNIDLFCIILNIINFSKNIIFSNNSFYISENIRLKNRFLDLRKKFMQNNLFIRFILIKYLRNVLEFENFINIETPILSKNTPEGSRDFIIPSRFYKNFYFALPQSPQIYKQFLMISSFDKYYQIAKCFRDEDLRKDRQPEFTQLDCEISFWNFHDIILFFTNILKIIFIKFFNFIIKNIFIININFLFIFFILEKIDFRIKFFIKSNIFYFKKIKYKNIYLISSQNLIFLFGNNFKNFFFFIKKFFLKSLIFLFFYNSFYLKFYFFDFQKKIKLDFLLILKIFNKLIFNNYNFFITFFEKEGVNIKLVDEISYSNFSIINNLLNYDFIITWIIFYHLFYYNYKIYNYDYNHNPFTKSYFLDNIYFDINVKIIISLSYDIVINNIEVGGGSLRNDKFYIQNKIFLILLNSSKNFYFFLNSLNYGTPNHCGIAIGLDRFLNIFMNLTSIRDFIAFPKTQNNNCLLTNSPNLFISAE